MNMAALSGTPGLKILFVTNTIGIAGAERQIAILTEKINAIPGYCVDVVYYKHLETAYSIDKEHQFFIDKDKFGRFGALRRMRKLIKEGRYDIVHAFGGGSANIYGRWAALRAKTPVIIGAMLGKKHFASPSQRILNALINRSTDYWTINNIELKPILLHAFPNIHQEHVFLVHNGFPSADDTEYQEKQRTDFDIEKGDRFVFGSVGRLVLVKNQALFIKAADAVKKAIPNAQFWLIGDGALREELEKEVNERSLGDAFRFWGIRMDVDAALRRMDVFVLTSNTEGSPNTLAEALRAGKPVVSTRSTDLSEMIAEGENGYAVPVGDEKALADAMIRIFKDCMTKREQMERKSCALFEKSFSIELACEELLSTYRKIMEARE